MSNFKNKLLKYYPFRVLGKLFGGNSAMQERRKKFQGSKLYWEQRYVSNKNSGSGSYGRLSEFKADIINAFVAKYNINEVLELGCGDGNQLTLAQYNKYIGVDVSQKAIDLCKSKFKGDASKSFFHTDDIDVNTLNVELVMSLDVIYHLIEDHVYEAYMNQLFNTSKKYVIIYSSNYDKEVDVHVKCRKFTNWIQKHKSPKWKLKAHIKNKYPFNSKDPNNTSMSDFFIYEKVS